MLYKNKEKTFMEKFGKINFLGDLEVATNVITTAKKIIVNPAEEEYLENGYKRIVEEKYPEDKKGFNIVRHIEQTETEIFVKYGYEEVAEENIERDNKDIIF